MEAAGKKAIVSLMVDEMAIRQHVEVANDKLFGYVDHGADIADESLNLAAHRPIQSEFHRPPTFTHLHISTSMQQLELVIL